MKRPVIVGCIVALIAGFAIWWFMPTQVVKRRTGKFLDTLTFPPGSGAAARQMGAYSLNSLLSESVELDTPTIEEANGTFERSQLESAYAWLGNSARRTSFKLEAIHSVTVNGDRAVVELTLDGLVELSGSSPVDGFFDVTFDWRKEKDGWRLTRAVWRDSP